ncbi:MAG TPA: tagaturonate reductase [Haploplasma sp.]|nr:tagaturonate reductase [Haploplasma sp.]
MSNLNRNTVKIPLREKVTIMQFGEGNFLRAFVDDFIQELNDRKLINEGVVVVQPVPFGRVKDLAEQDGLYNLFLEGQVAGEEIKVNKIIDILNDFINPYEELPKYLEYAVSEDLKTIISNTTEAGIVYKEELLSNDVTPESFPGKLLLLLKNRFDAKLPGLNIVPCELIDDNGDELKAILIDLAKYNKYEEDFLNWLVEDNRYYNTLVDRIVPGYPAANAKEIESELGYSDNSMVKGEVFHLWAIEGPKGLEIDLPFDKTDLDVEFVESIKAYKERKVKILNGSHTAIVPISYLKGNRSVRESLLDELVNEYLAEYLATEVIPTIDLPKDSMDKFAEDVLDRFLNPFIYHKLMDISLNSMTKYKTRILPTVDELLGKGTFPKLGLFSLASLMVFYRGEDLSNGEIQLTDNQEFLDLFNKLWAANDVTNLVNEVVALNHWETNSLNSDDVKAFLVTQVNNILNEGLENALKQVLGE